MKKFKIILTTLIIAIGIFPVCAQAQGRTESYTSYILGPFGYYYNTNAQHYYFKPVTKDEFTAMCTSAHKPWLVGLSTDEKLLFCNQDRNISDFDTKFVTNLPGIWKESPPNFAHLAEANKKVGIGTNDPKALLHLKNGNVFFQGGSVIDPPESRMPDLGAGTRVQWDPRNGSFRAGGVSGDYWDSGSTGLYSVALGYNLKAHGLYSTAFGGKENTIVGDVSSIFGGENNEIVGTADQIAGGNNVHITGDRLAVFNTPNAIVTGIYDPHTAYYSTDIVSLGVAPVSLNPTMVKENSVILWGDRIGINTPSPDATLDVNGLIKFGNGVVPSQQGTKNLQKRFPMGAGQEIYVIKGYVSKPYDPGTNAPITIGVTTPGLVFSYNSGYVSIDYSIIGFSSPPAVLITPCDKYFYGYFPSGPPTQVTLSTGFIPEIDTADLTANSVKIRNYRTISNTFGGIGYADSPFTFYIIGTLSNTSDGVNAKVPTETLPYTPTP